jgi:6-phosphofructo-2-kinase
MTARTMACDAALADLLDYMKLDGVRVSAFDATNSTKERRKRISDVLKKSGLGLKHIFVESICDEEDVRCLFVYDVLVCSIFDVFPKSDSNFP